jgi:sporulation protein YlmC with PRC-barrel domain
MLEDMLEKYEIVSSVGDKIGKIKEVYIDIEAWEIKFLKVSPGVVKSSFLLDLKDVETVDLENHRMIVKDDYERGDLPDKPTKHMYPYDDLVKHEVVDIEEEKIGKIYSMEVPYKKLKSFKIWKLLIRTGLTGRRLRLSPSEIEEVMTKIKLKGTLASYKGEEE